MKLGAARVDGDVRTIVIEGEEALVLHEGAPTPDDAVRDPSAMESIQRATKSSDHRSLETVELLPPIRRFGRDILCTGWNYWEHFEESKGKREGQDPKERPTHPTFFTKAPFSLIGPNADIAFDPRLSTQWDYEVEIALVIGRTGRSIPVERAREHIAGFAVANDISQREVQRAHGGQWFKGKSADASTPIGPWLTTADEVDEDDLQLSFDLNGQRLQSASSATMAFDIPSLIAELSFGMTLFAGDVLLTGTPPGIGNAREPQVFLSDGDVLVSAVSGLGELRNTVRLRDITSYRAGDLD